MRNPLASSCALLVTSGVILGLTGQGCSSSSPGAAADSGTPAVDSSPPAETSTAQDSSPAEASGDDDSSLPVNTCPAVSMTGNATCDSCIEFNCCDPLVACAGGDGGAPGGGSSCLADTICIVNCLNVPPAGGTLEGGATGEGGEAGGSDGAAGDSGAAAETGATDCATTCGMTYPANVQALGAAMEGCIVANCIGECTSQ